MTPGRVTRRFPPHTLHGGKPGLGGIGGTGIDAAAGAGVGKGDGSGVGKGVVLGVGTGFWSSNIHPHGALRGGY